MAKQKREQELEQDRQEETLERVEGQQMKPQQQEDTEEEDQPEKLNRTQCAQRIIAEEIDGDTTLSELGEKADALYRASRPDAEEDTDTAEWYLQKQLEVLEGMGMLSIRWEAVIRPNWVGKLAQISKNGK